MNRPLRLGISTCPNDTFAFHAILHQAIDLQGLEFSIELLDVQQLNERLARNEFDIAKASFHTALQLSQEMWVLSAGSALGFGVGPLLLSHHADKTPMDDFHDEHGRPRQPIVLCPGRGTTATLLYRLFYPGTSQLKHVVFSDIMPALSARQADFGVCIHEGRFTWQDAQLHCVADLGECWEQQTNQPLPLGGLLASRSLDPSIVRRATTVIRQSIEYGLRHPEETLPTMRKHAQEFTDDVLMSHVDLYVNDMTLDLGSQGQSAFDALFKLAVQSDIISADSRPLEIISPSS